jgi:hypothetical protein
MGLNKVAKAIAGGVTAGASAVAAALAAGNGHIDASGWGVVIAAAVAGFFTVWHTPNAPAEAPKPPAP